MSLRFFFHACLIIDIMLFLRIKKSGALSPGLSFSIVLKNLFTLYCIQLILHLVVFVVHLEAIIQTFKAL